MSASKHASLVYHRAALTHAVQIAAPAVVALTALFTLSLGFAIVSLVAVEGFLLVAVPRMHAFREDVDRLFEDSARAAAAADRKKVQTLMSPVHASELSELERLTASMSIERLLDLEPLLATYVRLSVAHRRSIEMFSPARWFSLEARETDVPTEADNRWAARRRSILAIRRETWERARRHRAEMEQALATIADVVHWMHELSAMPSEDTGHAAVDAVLEVCSSALGDVRQLEDLDAPVYQLACG